MSKLTAISPVEKQLNLQGYHRIMIPHVAFIIDFDRAHEFYKDFQALVPTDTESFNVYKKGHLRYYTCTIDICPNDILEIKSLIDLKNYDNIVVDSREINRIISTKYVIVQEDYSFLYVTKNEMMQALKDKINES